jgi:hypothetical protein
VVWREKGERLRKGLVGFPRRQGISIPIYIYGIRV